MKNKLGVTKRFLLLAAHLAASSVLAEAAVVMTDSPSQAAALGAAQSILDFNNFSQSPLQNTSSTPIDVDALDSSASGVVPNQVQTVGSFLVEAGQSFSFDFTANLNLQTSVDDLTTETANAPGFASFFLVDSVTPNTIYDSFVIYGNLTTPGSSDYLDIRKTDNIRVGGSSNTDFEGTQETASVNAYGSFSRSFDESTQVTLVKASSDSESVPVPEATNMLASVLLLGFLGWKHKARKK